MNILDNQSTIAKYNSTKVIESILYLPKQIFQAYQGAAKIKIPVVYSKTKNIVFCGMGGSNLASEMARHIFANEISRPLVLVRGYHLPKFVNQDSLVFISSYSGNTEETVSCLNQALKLKAKIICLSAGGKVMALARRYKLPNYKIDQTANPSNQPRYGVGSQVGAVMALFNKLKFIKVDQKEINDLVQYLNKINSLFSVDVALKNNMAKKVAVKIKGHLPVIVTAEFLSANGHILANQINEGADNLAIYNTIPELNHHLMEGLAYPRAIRSKLKFLFFNSDQYLEIIRKRFLVTQKVLRRQGIKYIEYSISGGSRLANAMELLVFGSWLSFYLAVLNGCNPADIPWVNFFKAELKK